MKVQVICDIKETTKAIGWEYDLLVFRKSKKSPTGPTERTPKPEYLIALATYLGVRW